MNDPEQIPFIDYWNSVEDLLKDQYGITCGDATDPELVAAAQEQGDSPQEYVDHIAIKYCLTPLAEWEWSQ